MFDHRNDLQPGGQGYSQQTDSLGDALPLYEWDILYDGSRANLSEDGVPYTGSTPTGPGIPSPYINRDLDAAQEGQELKWKARSTWKLRVGGRAYPRHKRYLKVSASGERLHYPFQMCDDEVAFCPQPETLLASDIQILGQPLRGTGNATPTRYAGVPGNAVVDATPFVKSPNHDVRPIVSLFRVEMYPDSAPPNIGDNPMKDPVAEHAKDTQNDPAHPGKVIYVNKGDIDGNEIPNFADAGNRGPGFGEVVLTFPDGIDLNAFKVKFKYDMNRPSDILQTGDSEDGFAYTPTKKGIRLWRTDASVVNGQMFLASDQIFTLAELNPTLFGDEFRPKYHELRLFVEGVTPSDFCDDKSLIVYANARADWEPNNFVPADSIAFTVVEANIELTRKNGDIVPEHKEEYNGTVVQIVPKTTRVDCIQQESFSASPN